MTAFSQDAHRYFLAHAIDHDLAAELGVGELDGALTYPYRDADGEYRRRRPLDGGKTFQPAGRLLTLWWPDGPPEPGGHVLLCEGEPDALAALTALRGLNGACPIAAPTVAALPGCGHGRAVEELRAAGVRSVTVCLDGDDAGRKAAERICTGLVEAGAEVARIDPGDGKDLADLLCAAEDGGEALAQLLADAEPSAPLAVETPEADSASWEPLHSVTAAEFAAIEEPGMDPVIGERDTILIPEGGDVLVYGDGGAGKTTLTLDLAVHLAAGDDWLDMPVPAARRVLLIEAEGPRAPFRAKVRRKLEAWDGGELGDRLRISDKPWSLVSLADPARREEIARMCAEREVDVIVAGPVTALGMIDAGTIAEVRAFQAHIGDIRRRAARSVTSTLVHHQNKAGMVSGAREGVCDTLLHVQAAGNGHTMVGVQKARWDSKRHGTTLKLAWRPGERYALEGDRDYVEEIRELLSDRWLRLKEIAAPKEKGGIGAAETTVKESLDSRSDVFEMRTGDAAKLVGHLPTAKVFGLRSGQNADNAEGEFLGGVEGVSASASALKDADAPSAPPTASPGSAFSAERRPDDGQLATPEQEALLDRLRVEFGDDDEATP